MLKIFSTLMVAAASVVASDAAGAKTEVEWLEEATLRWTPAYAINGVHAETTDEHAARRKEIAAAAFVAANDTSMPSLFGTGSKGRLYTALFVLAVWKHESHYDVRVQKHHCEGLPKGSCDGGGAYCLGQVHPKDVRELGERGWTGADLEADLGKCARATIWRLAAALNTCANVSVDGKKLEGGDKFAQYATGKCAPSQDMRARYQTAFSWVKSNPMPVSSSPTP